MSEGLLDNSVHVWKFIETLNFDRLINDVFEEWRKYSHFILDQKRVDFIDQLFLYIIMISEEMGSIREGV